MSHPAVTILICTHNGEGTIAAAVESALNQECSWPFEALVIDDGSSDSTASKVSMSIGKRNGKRARMTGYNKQQGLAEACNLGIGAAAGDYIIRIDDDDLLMPVAVEAMRPMIMSSEYWSFCDHLIVDIHTGTRRRFEVGPPSCDGWLPRLSACGVMMRRDILLELGGYRNLFWHEYDLYLRYLERAKRLPFYVAEPLYACASRPDGPTAASATMSEGWRELAGIWGEDVMHKYGFSVPA